jgi:hypothetical protein
MYLTVTEDSGTVIVGNVSVPAISPGGGMFTSRPSIEKSENVCELFLLIIFVVYWTPSKSFVDHVVVNLRFVSTKELISSANLLVAVPNIVSTSLCTFLASKFYL